MTNKPYCFVMMPFGLKKSPMGKEIDFDHIYSNAIAPAVVAAGMEAIRADEEQAGGIIHKAMFERLLLCPFAIADMSTANANVFYELGVRHSAKPYSTVLVHYKDEQLPFDTACFRSVPYDLNGHGELADAESLMNGIAGRLKSAIGKSDMDSPIYQVVDWMRQPDCLDHQKTDLFRERVTYSESIRSSLNIARTKGLEAVSDIHAGLGDLGLVESGVLVDLLLSYRAVEAWDEMINLVRDIPQPLNNTVLVREQLALALNRVSRRAEAESVLTKLIEERGASSETYGILGRIRKDAWKDSVASGNFLRAKGLLDRAIYAYEAGFSLDMRDPYPGVNLLTLLECRGAEEPLIDELFPVVIYAARKAMAGHEPDYWDFATLLELSVISKKFDDADNLLPQCLALVREVWELRTTLENLELLRSAWVERSQDIKRISAIMDAVSSEISAF